MAQATEPDGATTGLERARVLKRIKIKRDFGWHLATYVILNGFLTFVWSLGGGWFWPAWVIVPWGIGLAFHAASTFLGGPVTERDINERWARATAGPGVGRRPSERPRSAYRRLR